MMMMFVFLLIALIGLSYLLSRSTDILVVGIKQLSVGTAFEGYGLTTFLVALATSLPELFVAVAAALKGDASLPLGVVMGSNIANVSLVIGGAALLSGAVKARDSILSRDILYAFLVAALPLLMLLDKNLSRVDGLVMLVVYVLFVMLTLRGKKKKRLKKVEEKYYDQRDITHKVLSLVGNKDVEQGMMRLTVGSGMLIVSADLIVRLSEMMADLVGIPVILVGLFMVSVGTSLPEITFEIKTVSKKEYMMAFGNIIGSTVANSSLILGAGAVISPLVINGQSRVYYLSVVAFVLMYSMFWGFSYTKKRLERWEGLALIVAYFGFVLVQMVWSGL